MIPLAFSLILAVYVLREHSQYILVRVHQLFMKVPIDKVDIIFEFR